MYGVCKQGKQRCCIIYIFLGAGHFAAYAGHQQIVSAVFFGGFNYARGRQLALKEAKNIAAALMVSQIRTDFKHHVFIAQHL